MSNSHRPLDSDRDRVARVREAIESPPSALRRPIEFLAVPLRFVAFWAAVTLPFLYLPLLVGGLDGSEPLVFGSLLAANAVALVAGHGYGEGR